MGSQKPRRLSSLIMGILIIFSAFAVLNITSTNVLAASETIWWDYGYTVNDTSDKWFPRPGYDSCTIIMRWGNLTIESGYTLTFNDSVTFEIWNTIKGIHGIEIENDSYFVVDSPSADTIIKSEQGNEEYTYWFTNSGTIDFLGATVERVYGDPDTSEMGGIVNEPGSVCELTNCTIQDVDTHGIYLKGTSSNDVELKINNVTFDKTTTGVMEGTGIWIKEFSNVNLTNLVINNSQKYGVHIDKENNVTIQNASILNSGEHGVYLQESNITISDSNVSFNNIDGIVIIDGSAPIIESNVIGWNDRHGIRAENALPIIKDNTVIKGNGESGIYMKDVNIEAVYGQSSKIENNYISYNKFSGINCYNSSLQISNNTISKNGLGQIFNDDMENGESKWDSYDGMWHRVEYDATAPASPPAWNISNSGNWSWWFGDDDNGNYTKIVDDDPVRNFGNLTSDNIDLTSSNYASLSFWTWYETDTNGTSTDQRWVIISNSTNETKHQLSGDFMKNWTYYTYNISEYIGSSISITFNFDTINEANNSYQGWYIDDVEVVGCAPVTPWGSGIVVESSTLGIKIKNNTINENSWFGIILNNSKGVEVIENTLEKNNAEGVFLVDSENNEIKNNNLSSSFYGINLLESNNNQVENNFIDDNKYAGIRLESNWKGTYSNIVKNNTINNTWGYLGSSIGCLGGKDNEIDGNIITNSSVGIYGFLTENYSITSNSVKTSINGIRFEDLCEKNIIDGNFVTNNKYGVIFNSCFDYYHNTISNNNIFNNSAAAIVNHNADNTIILNNTISSNGYWNLTTIAAIRVNIAANVTLENNMINNNNHSGVCFYKSSNNTIINNTFLGNNEYGLELIIDSDDNKIYHNNFINNTNQTFDSGDNNSWDNGYPSGGNFWGDYYGNDTKSGANQNQAGSDNIGDTNYTNIDGGSSVDNYPLMQSASKYNGKYFRKPIRINNNTDLNTSSKRGVSSGNGSKSNPWIIEDYYIDGYGYENCIYIGNTTEYFEVKNCELYDASAIGASSYFIGAGVNLHNVTNGSIDKNSISNNDYGIYTYTTCNTSISNNDISDNSEGLRFDIYSCNNTARDNIFSGNSWGCYIVYYSNNNTLSGNNISSNDDYGILIDGSHGNIIKNNNLSSNGDYGVSIWSYYPTSSENNTIYHNNFYDNNNSGIQAEDTGVNNTWDNGYPSGGNYWSDYNGTDDYGGPDQDQSGNDGIGDTNYSTDGDGISGSANSEDNYPLMYENTDTYTYWAKAYGENNLERTYADGQQTSDGGYIVVGYSRSFDTGNKYEGWIMKLDTDGVIEWNKTFGENGYDDVPTSVQQVSEDAGGGYIVSAATDSFGAGLYDFWLLKFDADGTLNWSKTYGYTGKREVPYYVQEIPDVGYIMAGYREVTDRLYDVWVIKTHYNGTAIWDKSYGGSGYDYARHLQVTSEGGYIVTGVTKSWGATYGDIWVIKLDIDGSMTWNKTYGGSGIEDSWTILETDNGYIVAGTTTSEGAGSYDFWVLNLTSIGDVSWQKTYGGGNQDQAYCISPTTDGNFIISGSTRSFGAGNNDFWVIKIQSNGDILWQRTYGGELNEVGYNVFQNSDGGYMLTGYTSTFGEGLDDIWALEIGPNGGITFDEGSEAYVNATFVLGNNSNCANSSASVCTVESTNVTESISNETAINTACKTATQASPSYGWYNKD